MTTYAEYGAQADAQIAALTAELYACQHPTPPPLSWFVGVSAGPSIAEQLAKWGPVPLRVFYGGRGLGVDVLPHGGCASWNPTLNAMGGLSAADLSAVVAWAKAQTQPVSLAGWHELDVKKQAGQAVPTLAQFGAMNVQLRSLMTAYPLVTVRAIFGAHLLVAPVGYGNVAAYLAALPAGFPLGFDFDGSRPTALPYTDYAANIANFTTIAAAHPDITVPEFGVPQVSDDPSGASLAAWLLLNAGKLRTAGARAVYLFDTAPEGPLVPGSLPFTAYKQIIAG